MNNKVLYQLSYGLYIISSVSGDKYNGQVANTVFQITSEPPTVAVSINKKNLTHTFIEKSGVFTVSVLPVTAPMELIGKFGFKSGRDVDKFAGVSFRVGVTSAPILLENTLGYLEAEVIKQLDVETHTIFIGRVMEAEMLGAGEPMTYAYYHAVKKGSAPPTAPTYIKPESSTVQGTEKPVPQPSDSSALGGKFKCSVCGYIYDPALGDPDSGQAAGTAFPALPESWVCPICGAGKEEFVALP